MIQFKYTADDIIPLEIDIELPTATTFEKLFDSFLVFADTMGYSNRAIQNTIDKNCSHVIASEDEETEQVTEEDINEAFEPVEDSTLNETFLRKDQGKSTAYNYQQILDKLYGDDEAAKVQARNGISVLEAIFDDTSPYITIKNVR